MDADLAAVLHRIEQKIDSIRLSEQQQALGDLIMSSQLDTLTAQVTENTNTEASAVALLNNLHDLLVAAGTDPVKLTELAGTLKGSSDALAAAIVANTPAAG